MAWLGFGKIRLDGLVRFWQDPAGWLDGLVRFWQDPAGWLDGLVRFWQANGCVCVLFCWGVWVLLLLLLLLWIRSGWMAWLGFGKQTD